MGTFRTTLVIGLLLTAGVILRAAVVPRYSLEELTQNSALIVHARVLGSRVAWDERGLYLWTHYRLAPVETIKGTAGGEVIVSEPGGTLAGVTLLVSDAVQFEQGEEVVVFLYRNPLGYWRVRGYGQGKLTLVGTKDGGKRLHANVGALQLVETGGAHAAGPGGVDALDGWTLDRLRGQLRLWGGR